MFLIYYCSRQSLYSSIVYVLWFPQITVVRSPDGVSKQWIIGSFSIQRAAVWVLQNYYAEFPTYNPHLDRMPSMRKRHSSVNGSAAPSFKFYDFDGVTSSFTSVCSFFVSLYTLSEKKVYT